MTRTYTDEFPEFDYALPVIPGFEDTSWHNDTCPSLTLASDAVNMILWCDYADVARREWDYGKKFTLMVGEYGDVDADRAVCESDSLETVLEAIATAIASGAALQVVRDGTTWSLLTDDGCAMFETDDFSELLAEIART